MKRAKHKPSDHEPHIVASAMIAGEQAGLANPKFVEKRWGGELIYINTPDYCMKRIYIKKGERTSMHFHVKKHETLLVVHGELTLKYKDKESNDIEIIVPPHHAWVVCPGFQHQLCAPDGDVVIIEASTYDSPDDSVRVRI